MKYFFYLPLSITEQPCCLPCFAGSYLGVSDIPANSERASGNHKCTFSGDVLKGFVGLATYLQRGKCGIESHFQQISEPNDSALLLALTNDSNSPTFGPKLLVVAPC